MRHLQAPVTGIMLMAVAFTTQAQAWEFSSPVDVTPTMGAGVFHHLESSGRRNIAVSENTVTVAWEDNRNDMPHIYLASKQRSTQAFSDEIKISGNGEAYEPSLVTLDQDRFAVAWEEDSQIRVRLVTPAGPGPILNIDQKGSSQASIARHQQQLLLVYSSTDTNRQRIRFLRLGVEGQKLRKLQDCPVDAQAAKDDQLYPTVISLGDRTIVAWEDRRLGYTIIMAAQSHHKTPCHFSKPQRISAAPAQRILPYGKGHGVARVALTRYGTDKVLAVWADKRDFREGYDIYAAHYQADDKNLFGSNEKVQDSFGDVAQQWHPTVAGHRSGQVVVAWDDNRDGDANIMLSWLEDNEWSDDTEVPGASGQGEQAHPSIYLDKDSNLHTVWIERSKIGGPTRLRYAFGKAINK